MTTKNNQALAVKKEAGITTGYSKEQIDLIKTTVAKGATDDELKLFITVAKKAGLDPFTRQIHFVKRRNSKTGKDEGAIQAGIDGYRAIAERTGVYAGNDDPIFDNEKDPKKATVTVYKIVAGVRCPFNATARWDQYFPGEARGFMWKKMPHLMLGKCAEALALRKAFPNDLSGIYTHEEMQQADGTVIEAESVTPEQPKKEQPMSEYYCEKHDDSVKLVPAGISKQGKPYKPFWSCGVVEDGKYCKARLTNSDGLRVRQNPETGEMMIDPEEQEESVVDKSKRILNGEILTEDMPP